MAAGFMRGKAERRELVETFVAWFAPGQPPPRKNAVRGFARDLLEIAGDEPIDDDHLDALVRKYRKRFAGPRTIVDARHVGEQMRHWCEERAKGRVDITAPPPASGPPPSSVPPGDEPGGGDSAAAGGRGARGSRPPSLVRDTLPDSSPPRDEEQGDVPDFEADLAQVAAAAARAAKLNTLPGTGGLKAVVTAGKEPSSPVVQTIPGVGDEAPAPVETGLEIDFGDGEEAAAVPRTNTIPGLGKAIADAKERHASGKKKRISGPTLPGMGIVKVLGETGEPSGERAGIFRGTLPGMGKAEAGPAEDTSTGPPAGKSAWPSSPPSEPPARGSRPPTQPGVGETAAGSEPRLAEPTAGRTQPGVARPPGSVPPPGPVAQGDDQPPAASPPDAAATTGTGPRSEPPGVPPQSAPSAPPPGSPSAPPPAPSVPPTGSVPPRPSHRPVIPVPPPTLLERVITATGIQGTPGERMRAKLVAMGIAAMLLMLLIMSARHCL